MALSPNDKFIYVNPDTVNGEYDTARYFPVRYLRGLETASASDSQVWLYFRGPKDAWSTRITISITAGFVKEFFVQFVDEINYGENAIITLVDRNIAVDSTTGGTDFQHVNAFVVPAILSDSNTAGYEDVQVAEDLDVGGDLSVSGDITAGGSTVILKQTKTTLSEADMDDLHNTAITLVAAQGVDKIIIPVSILMLVDRDASTAQSNINCDIFLSWSGSTSTSETIGYHRRFMYNETGDRTYLIGIDGDFNPEISQSISSGGNRPFTVKVDSAVTAGSIDEMVVYTTYYVIDNS